MIQPSATSASRPRWWPAGPVSSPHPVDFMVAAVALVYVGLQAAIGDPEPTLTIERHVEPMTRSPAQR